MSNWLLPESLADILPAEARRIEELRRDLLDLYRTYGFELVAPPLVEYLESLQAVSGTDLNLRTSKVVDQISGRTMGVRADMTPQVARIDAHLLNREGVTRLCYCGSVLHARPAGLLSDRELLQIGAEIFGHAGIESDLEVVQLALESVGRAGVRHPRLDLNYPDLGRFLIERDPILKTRVAEVCELLNAKDVSGLRALGRESGCLPETTRYLLALTSLYGDGSVLERARSVLPDEPEVREALGSLRNFIDALPGHEITVDLADIGSGYAYHSGLIFSVYAEGWHDALVKGGRFDGIGRMYGRARPATGFSLDLRKLSAGLAPAQAARAVRAPWGNDAALIAAVKQLRQNGEIVIQMLPGQELNLDEFVIDRELVSSDGQWQVRAL
ncbi:ATP phosphoribosyltransferase regulatory subunit [Alcaligenes faecalis]|jgi:ATP phosphoribosyltransferase regulatory subunit|uniref:ATP phosphoribosyltransferase regulatory subunit n=1 Tax=Alcaligenes faecalis TaxID=511 RepID=A0A2U2BP50_ALCFA|nr:MULTISPECIES: ATP phosphoribosyltransferase regulatory subunit [Alcaligenes]ARP54104.1 ATP phosphoribosyltransferase [Alcaligenes faecalis]MBH0309607.1 ATP phosphoribosyltransferase regulatory subunit [Alcaligenes faecalis]MBW4788161.1 ATP phosphoribosyltransferase regulatory subunit [Alcaligenes faecalis subsp. faecalis]MBY6308751.1 ATP phosphoribosyltransferase regulatory subunit [Alcaligenes faecalis]MBY6316562.1 ATP phosphoribosyltransferase regulatory subunit [Alcaligenes faecalis]